MADDPTIKSRIKSTTRGKFVQRLDAKFHFGTPEEIGNRVGGSFKTLSDNTPSSFKQIGPDESGGQNVAGGGTPRRYSGTAKFGEPRKYA